MSAKIPRTTAVEQASISQPNAAGMRTAWAKNVPDLTPGVVLVDMTKGVSLHQQTASDTLDTAQPDRLIAALVSVHSRIEAVGER
ncbi:hypothetical protein [Nocardiopsis synnemataformans]|uniref:hypothetical protein n=1 Tax=Nocardiopsis synnemataformans TaxID=61305 RepID=UPI003EC0DCFD